MKGGREVGPVSKYTRDLCHQHSRKGKIVMTKISRYQELVLGFWHLKLIWFWDLFLSAWQQICLQLETCLLFLLRNLLVIFAGEVRRSPSFPHSAVLLCCFSQILYGESVLWWFAFPLLLCSHQVNLMQCHYLLQCATGKDRLWESKFYVQSRSLCGRPTAFETYLGQRPGRRP